MKAIKNPKKKTKQSSQDTTERKRIEEQLKESEEKFRKIFESANDALIYLDRLGRILEVNKNAVQVFGGSKKEVMGKHFTKVGIFSARDISQLMTLFAKILVGKNLFLVFASKTQKARTSI